ncbi:MAG: hypothetical protein ABJA98_06215 [Acidobacteriota bacterium]
MTRHREQPWYHLTRHFFNGLFDLGFLSEAGADSFTRMIVGCGAVFLAFGLLLVRLFMVKYAVLSSFDTPEPYRQALLADHAFLLAVPMWIVACVTALAGHSLFPDLIDFRVLMALPVSRRLVFATKLLALTLFTGLFMLAAHAALLPLLLLMSVGRWAEPPWPLQLTTHAAAGLLGSAFSVTAVTALHGLVVLAAPRGRQLAVSAALRSATLGLLIVSLPMVLRLPGQARAFADGSAWLYAAPPAWFLGLERWLSGDAGTAPLIHLAEIAGAALTIAAGLAGGSYLVLYRRFDRVMSRPPQGDAQSPRRFRWMPGGLSSPATTTARRRPVFDGTRMFTRITLRRSVLHQGIVVALSAVGVGLVVNNLMAADLAGWMPRRGSAGVALTTSVIWAPFALMFVASLAVRLALAVPIEPRANWVFRMTEQHAGPVDQLDAALHTVRRLGAVVPLVAIAPLEWLVLGRDAIGVVAVALLFGGLLVEILMRDWARIPFTCSYIPGKGFVPQTVLTGLLSFVLFTTSGAVLARVTLTGHRAAFALDAMLFALVLALGRYRRSRWTDTPLAFEDQLPVDVNPIRLME